MVIKLRRRNAHRISVRKAESDLKETRWEFVD